MSAGEPSGPSEGIEAVFARLEQQFTALQQDHELVKSDRDRLQSVNEQLSRWLRSKPVGWHEYDKQHILGADTKTQALQEQVATQVSKFEEARTTSVQLEHALKRAADEKESLQASLDLRQQELDRIAGMPSSGISMKLIDGKQYNREVCRRASCSFTTVGGSRRP